MIDPLYIETRIRAPLAEVWERTQDPEDHQRWDLRFTTIDYLPRSEDGEPQRFRYATRLGFGLGIEGGGETTGVALSTSTRTSALKFWSDHPRSLIRDGSGYWKYEQDEDESVRFYTGYDYRVRFGVIGRTFDRWIFRPLIGWATAWSFDRLRIWLESGRDPVDQLRLALIHALARVGVAFVWLWHGLVPKLVFDHPLESQLLIDAGIDDATASTGVLAAGIAEVLFGLMILVLWRARWPLWVTIGIMTLATIGVAVHSAYTFRAAFNPMTLNVQLALLAGVALVTGRDLPSARRCLRKKPRHAADRHEIPHEVDLRA